MSANRRVAALLLSPAVLSIAGYLAFTVRYTVNTIYWDEWANVRLVQKMDAGSLGVSDLWGQHTDNRMVVPRLFDLAVGRWLRYDVRWLIYAGVVLLGMAAVALVLAHRRLHGHPMYVYTPVVMILFTPVQWQNTLWEFQFSFFLVVAAFLGAVLVVTVSQSRRALGVAVVLALVASFSCVFGLFVWLAVGLLVWASRPRAHLMAWSASAAVTAAVYFHGYHVADTPGASYIVRHPVEALRFFLTLLGGFSRGPGKGLALAQALGLLMLAVAAWVLARFWLSERRLPDAIPACLVIFALLYDVATTFGRIAGGTNQALSSRYTTPNLLLLVAGYLALIDRRESRVPAAWRPRLRAAQAVGVAALVMTLGAASVTTAVDEGRAFAVDRRTGAALIRDLKHAPASQVYRYVCPEVCGDLVPAQAAFLADEHLSVFADNQTGPG